MLASSRRICSLLAMPSYIEICARNYLQFIARYCPSSRRWKKQDLGVNQGFKPCVRYILHLKRLRTFFNTVLSVANFIWPLLGMLYYENLRKQNLNLSIVLDAWRTLFLAQLGLRFWTLLVN